MCGKPGTGKSYTALSIAWKSDPDFSVDNVCFSADDFMSLIRGKLPEGSFIVADEIGAWMSNREYQSTSNKCLSYVLQTFRFKKFGILWTTPMGRFVDVNLRSLSDAIIETLNVDRRNRMVVTKYKNVLVNPITGDVRYPYAVHPQPGDCDYTTFLYNVGKPPDKLIREYEKKKRDSLEPMYEEWHDRMIKADTPIEKQQPNAKCGKCNYEWFTNATKPRCYKCGSLNVVVRTPI